MLDRPLLTPEERVMFKQHIERLESRARRLPRLRVVLVVVMVLTAMLAVHCLYDSFRTLTRTRSVADRLESIEIPPGAPPDLWFVAELRRSVLLLEGVQKLHMLAMFEGVVGIILAYSIAFGFSVALVRRNEGIEQAVLARMLKWYLSQDERGEREETPG